MSGWHAVRLGEVVTFRRGYDLPHSARKAGAVPIVTSAGITDYHSVPMVNSPGVVTGRYGTIGEVFFITKAFWPLNTTLYVRDFHGNDPRFIYYLLQRFDFRSFSGKSGVPGVNRNDLHMEVVALPIDIEEQRAIAAALSDVDRLLSGLDRLIAKKRDLKQAAMQQLLTGQTRLPGFYGEWVVKRLGELGEISGAGVDKKIRPNEMPIRLLNYMDVYKKDFLKSSDIWHQVSARPGQIRRCSLQYGDLFFTPTSEIRDDIGHSAVATEDMPDVVYSYHVVRLRLFENWDVRFRAYVFKTKEFLDQASTQAEGSGTRYVITLPKFRSIRLRFPRAVEEQTAIADVLSDMDAELAGLEQRREKTRALKQAMMQELLTGKTRLVAAGEAVIICPLSVFLEHSQTRG